MTKKKVKRITIRIAGKEATRKTGVHTLKTALEAFCGVLAAGLGDVFAKDIFSPEARIALASLLALAVSTAVTAFLNEDQRLLHSGLYRHHCGRGGCGPYRLRNARLSDRIFQSDSRSRLHRFGRCDELADPVRGWGGGSHREGGRLICCRLMFRLPFLYFLVLYLLLLS